MPIENLVELIRNENRDRIYTYLATNGLTSDVGEFGESPLTAAIQSHLFDIAEAILDLSPDIHHECEDGWGAVDSAARAGNTRVFKKVLASGGDVKKKLKDPLQKGMTPLHWAVNQGHLSIVKLCLEHGALIDAQEQGGFTPLMYVQHSLEVAELLVQSGASRTIRNKQGRNAYKEFVYQTSAKGEDLDSDKELSQISKIIKPDFLFGIFK